MTHAVVVGSGIAGLTFALHAVRRSVRVTLVTKGCAAYGSTRHAQGGIAGVVFPEDRAASHIEDTLTAGAGLSDPAAVEVLVAEGPDRIRELAGWGVEFDRDASGALARGLEAAHSFPRILHAGGDATGLAIETVLLRTAREAGVRIVEHAFLEDLVVTGGRVTGARVLVDGRTAVLRGDAVVLATGGIGQVFARTTNPLVATGDGIAAALRAGAMVQDMEFVQFHPTVLAVGEPFLVSEAVRGEGAVLIDGDGRRFAFDAHPDGELAPRDVVARACAAAGSVWLDATSVPELRRRFPSIDAAVREHGLDWTVSPVPVTPAAHYLMGGVSVDLDGRSSLPGLYAVGECARTGVHGANRLASNSLLEGAVWGARAAAAVADAGTARRIAAAPWPSALAHASAPSQNSVAHHVSTPLVPRSAQRSAAAPSPVVEQQAAAPSPVVEQQAAAPSPLVEQQSAAPSPVVERGSLRPSRNALSEARQGRAETAAPSRGFTRQSLQSLMWTHAGLARTAAGLALASETIAAWRAAASDPVTVAEREDANLLLVAQAVVEAALARRESVGAHWRADAEPVPVPELATAGAL